MHVGRNRIFVGNLPPSINENDIKEKFGEYGSVVSVEIKHRKENNVNENVSPVFAFVTIEIDRNQLHECFQSIANYNWNGYYVKLELAKESFLERLKREREEAQLNKTNTNTTNTVIENIIDLPPSTLISTPNHNKKVYSSGSSDESSSSSDSSSSDEDEAEKPSKKINGTQKPLPVIEDLVIKSNKNKQLVNGKLTIESVSNSSPIHVITPKFGSIQKEGEKLTAADEKRLNSLYKLKESYNQQKNLIKNALSQIDTHKTTNKIIFNDDGQQTNTLKRKQNFDHQKNDKKALFDGADDDDDSINFQIKNQFEGRKGQRLLELQSRYTNDKRFTLDSRFVDDEEAKNDEENELFEDDEKQKQLEILENVIGKKLTNNKIQEKDQNKFIPRGMLRYDPTNIEHSKFEIKAINGLENDVDSDEEENEKIDEAPVEVSKEKFYKVTDNLKQAFKESQGFSLLSMFGQKDVEEKEPEKHETQSITKSKFDNERNPFRYDSSDSEDEQIKRKTDVNKSKPAVFGRPLISGEKFFFQNQDERLKDGLSFLKKFNGKTEKFMETRREIKEIIRLKLRNVQRNNRPFRKKIGQHQQHKRIKIKKAKKN